MFVSVLFLFYKFEEKSTAKDEAEQNEGEEETEQVCTEETLTPTLVEEPVPTTDTTELPASENSPCTPPKPTPMHDEEGTMAPPTDVAASVDVADEKVKSFETPGLCSRTVILSHPLLCYVLFCLSLLEMDYVFYHL